MNKYIKENVVINATEKAYNVIYKEQGFVPYKEEVIETVKTDNETSENATKEVEVDSTETNKVGNNDAETSDITKDIAKMKKEELIAIAAQNGIVVPENATKEVLVKLLIGELEKKEEAGE